ncbi:MAG: ATP synthase F1 subunit gamma [Alphaproteobacteria bacterium]
MSSLQDLRNRKKSVQATQKITAAMKMVAGAKLRRCQAQRDTIDLVLTHLQQNLGRCLSHLQDLEEVPALLAAPSAKANMQHLVVLLTSDRGLCGHFNQQLLRAARDFQKQRQKQGEQVAFYCLGRKGYEALKKNPHVWVLDGEVDLGKPTLSFEGAQRILQKILSLMQAEQLGHVTLAYNKFQNVMVQHLTFEPLFPICAKAHPEEDRTAQGGLYLYEPSVPKLLEKMLPFFLELQLYQAMVESYTSEQGARMTAMDSATRNAEEMIKKLALAYNRTRQASITKELIEIISGAEAL